jgi:hypothetical protein
MHGFGKNVELAELVGFESTADDGVFTGLNGSGFGDAAPPSVVFAVD